MYQGKYKQHGFTLIEVLVVLAIFVIIATILFTGIRNFSSYQQYEASIADITFQINQSRLNARSATDDSSHGVHFATGSTTRFEGSSYIPGDSNNEVTLFQLVTIETDLSGGVDDVIFDRLSGLPSATGTVTITGTRFGASTTITISSSGVIQ